MRYAPNLEAFDSAADANPSLSAFIIYQDMATGKRAKEVCDMVTEKLGPEWNIEIEMSNFSSLRIRRLRQNAIETVASANLVIFSCHDKDLPFEVWEWMELWVTLPVRPMALVALLARAPGKNGHASTVEKYLAGVARRRGMDYFSHVYHPGAATPADQLFSILQKEPNDDSSCATDTRDLDPRGL